MPDPIGPKQFIKAIRPQTWITFDVLPDGYDEAVHGPKPAPFRVQPEVSPGAFLDMAAITTAADPYAAGSQLTAFLDAAMQEDDAKEFARRMHLPPSDPWAIDVDVLMGVVEWLGEVYTARPTTTPEKSSGS